MHSAAAPKENFLALLAEFTAGDPMRQGVLWLPNLSRREISRRLADRLGLEIGIVFDAHLPRWNYRTVPANGRAWEVVTGHILVAFW